MKVLIPLPTCDYDPTEVAIPWKIISEKKHEIVFATPTGEKPTADIKMLEGKNLGIWKSILPARKDAVAAYREMEKTEAFCQPLQYAHLKSENFDAMLFPGGHDKGMKEYLESAILQNLVVDFFKAQKPVAAICHGVLLVTRSIDPSTQKSVLYNYKTTALLQSQELLAYNMTRLWLKDYYLTYPGMTVEKEVTAALSNPSNFQKGSFPLFRDSLTRLKRGFCVRDRNYLSARWPGDAYCFSLEFLKMLEGDNKE